MRISPAALDDIDKFEKLLAQYLAGELDEDRFRVFRLANGIYGQRQGGTNQMVRVKIPYGSLRPEQLEMLAHIARGVLPGLGPHHHPAERAVPLRGPGADPRRDARPRLGRADHPGGLRRHRPQRGRLPPGRRLPVRGARHQPLGRGDVPALPPPPLRPAPAPQVQDQLLGLRHRLRAGHVQRRRRRGRHPGPARRHAWSPASGSSSPAASAPPPTRPRRWRSSRPGRTCWPPSRRSCGSSTTTATATTSSGPA